jgi:ectoine hydroxylase-related dioxygenase (phytanoyl-CoA dioxygenase family)
MTQMSNVIHWKDLEDSGFVVVPGFLPPQQIELLLEGFETGPSPESYPFGFKLIGRDPLKAVWPTIEPALAEIRACTSIKTDTVNFLTVSHYITTRHADRSSYLHQDFDVDYRLTGDHFNYLNFWVPLRKPERSRSNVTLVPFDKLRSKAPDEHARLFGGGGYRFIPQDGRTAVFGSAYGKILSDGDDKTPERFLSFDLEDIAVTPPLDAGDLLLMRGDVIHRTQDTQTDRVAASVRATYSGKVVTAQRAQVHAEPKAKDLDPITRLLHGAFARSRGANLTIGELVDISRGAPR